MTHDGYTFEYRAPTKGDRYYDSTKDKVYEWDGTLWVQREPTLQDRLDMRGSESRKETK